MKNTLTRTLALMMALLLALSVCAFADETDVTATMPDETDVTATMPDETDVTTTMPGETVETVEPTDDLIDDVDETPAEAEGELEEEPVEVEEELVVEDAPEIVTDEAMYGVNYTVLKLQIGGIPIYQYNSETEINVTEQFNNRSNSTEDDQKIEYNPIRGKVTLTTDGNNHTLTLQDAEITGGYTCINNESDVGKLTINLIGSNSVTGYYGIQSSGADLEIKGEANSSLTINADVGGILLCDDYHPDKEAKLTVSGGNVTVKTTGYADLGECYGIRCTELTLTGGELTATSGIVRDGRLSLGVALGNKNSEKLTVNKTRYYFQNGKLNADGMVIRSGADAASSVEMDAETYLALLAKQEYTVVLHEAREAEPTSLKYFHAEPKKEVEPTPPLAPAPAPVTPTTAAPAPEADGLIVASMKTAGKTGFKFTWTPIAGAGGYDVFLCNCGEKDYDVVATADGSAKSITVWKLKKYTAYKGYVRAWQMVNGQKTYITAASPMMHAITGGNTNKYTNPKKIKVKKAKFTLKPGKAAKIRASVKKLENSKNLLDHEAKVRYYSSNPAVATVDANGKITAVAAGKCKIYVIAINGLRKAVTVKVKQK